MTIGSFNPAWNTVYKSRGTVNGEGYDLEIAYPFRSLKYPSNAGGQEWGVMITRKIPSEGAKYGHPHLDRGHPRLFSQAVPLTGVKPARRGSGLELIPSLTAIYQENEDDQLRPSLDARFGITPNIGIAGTLNPDFSQVEYDETPIALNQRFAFWFPERRQFFLDGTDNFADPHDMLYTRSIVEPTWGAKVSGREGPWTVGVLNAVDRSPSATVNENATPGFTEDDVDDAVAVDTAVRLRSDAFDGGAFGISWSDKRLYRDGGMTGLHQGAGVDVNIPLGNRWTGTASTFQSFTGPSVDAMAWGQENKAAIGRAGGKGTGFTL